MLIYNCSKGERKNNKKRKEDKKMANIVNAKKISQELVKNFYSKKDKMSNWNVIDYEKISKLVMFNSYSIFRVFKDDILIGANEHGVKDDTLKEFFNTDLSEYKKAEVVEIKKKYDANNKKFYTCFDGKVWINDDMLKYLDSKQQYQYWYKSRKEPIFITTNNDFKVAMICPVNIRE
jgi:phage anti-repressor protein